MKRKIESFIAMNNCFYKYVLHKTELSISQTITKNQIVVLKYKHSCCAFPTFWNVYPKALT